MENIENVVAKIKEIPDEHFEYEYSSDGINWSDTPPEAVCNIWARPKTESESIERADSR